MNVNLHLTGELEEFIDGLVRRGIAANKTEAIRYAIARYYEDQLMLRKKVSAEALEQSTAEAHWNNPSDERSSIFYKKRYLDDKST